MEKIKSFLKSIIALASGSVDKSRHALGRVLGRVFGGVLGSGAQILAMFGLALGIVSLCVFFSVSLLRENTQNVASRSTTPAAPKVLKIAYSQNVGALNPQGYNKNAMFAQNIVYEGLLKADKNGAIVPSLATSFSLDKSGKIYTFSLRKGVKFSNGEEFNADAVVLNFTSIIKNRIRHSWSGLANALDRAEKVDDYTVKIVLKEPYAPTLNELALPRPFRFLAPSAFPSDLDLVAHNPKPIGTGSYMLVETKLGFYDKFAKNPHYWDAQRLEKQGGLYYDEVVIKVIFEPNSKLSALRAGQVDMIYGADEIPTRIFQEIRNEELRTNELQGAGAQSTGEQGLGAQGDSGGKKLRAYLGQASFITSLILNSNRIKEAQIRKAIALSIDKDTAINAVYGMYGMDNSASGAQGNVGYSTNSTLSLTAGVADSIFVYTRVIPPSLAEDAHTVSSAQLRQNLEFKPQNSQDKSPAQKGQNLQNKPKLSHATRDMPHVTHTQATQSTQHAQNLAKAREILASFGYTEDNPLKLELFFFGDKPSQKMLAQILQSQLKEAHIALSVRGLEPSMYSNARSRGEFDMAFVDSWGAPYEPLSQLHGYTIPPGHGDYIAQSALEEKPRIDALISQAIKESASVANPSQNPAQNPQSSQNLGQNRGTDFAQNSVAKSRAQALSDEAIELLIQSGVYIPLVIEYSKAVAHSRIRGVESVSSLSYEIPIWDFYE